MLLAAAVLPAADGAPRPGAQATVRIVGFSDYHSHAVPFYSEGRDDQAGIARAVAFLREATSGAGTVVLSGGDMVNRGSPTWSDEYGCVEWPWLRGLVDAMALGNHDLDYGLAEFEKCRAAGGFPVLAANLRQPGGRPALVWRSTPYLVVERAGVRVGAFAVAGPDVQRLVRAEALPPGSRWTDATATARAIVAELRGKERVDAVVLFGHQNRDEAWKLARAVPGIDLVLGSHSHDKSELVRIPGTDTHYISPFQYLTYLADVRLTFRNGRRVGVSGRLVRMDSDRPRDPDVSEQVDRLQEALQTRYPDRFAPLGQALVELADADVSRGESVIGDWVTEVLRQAAGVHVFFATASSFRGSIPPGPITLEALRLAVPYANRILTVELTGREILEWLRVSEAAAGTGNFSQQTGVRYQRGRRGPERVSILADPARREAGFRPLDLEATYRVGTTDYQARHVTRYRELFEAGRGAAELPVDVHEALIGALRAGPVAAALDSRVGG